jgi:Na+/melibiose symporter-like transporter
MEHSSSSVQTLQAPLLGVMPDEVDQEHHITADIAVLASHQLVADDDDEYVEEDQQEETAASYFCYNILTTWIVFPLLLLVQFGVALRATTPSQEQDEEARLASNMMKSWSTIIVNIALFCLTSWLYRNACIDNKMNASYYYYIVMLLPEIILNTVLILVTLHKTPLAFYTLLMGTQLLCVLAIIATVRFLYCNRHDGKDEDKVVSKNNDDYMTMMV